MISDAWFSECRLIQVHIFGTGIIFCLENGKKKKICIDEYNSCSMLGNITFEYTLNLSFEDSVSFYYLITMPICNDVLSILVQFVSYNYPKCHCSIH